MELRKLPDKMTVCKVSSVSDIDLTGEFYFIGRTEEEISLVCRTEDTPEHAIGREDGWRGFRIQGNLDFSLVGILSQIAGILAEQEISIFAISTYHTDYILVKEEDFDHAMEVLALAGYDVDETMSMHKKTGRG